MNLFLKRDISSEGTLFIVFDELGKEKYYVVRDNRHSHFCLAITDTNFNRLCSISTVPLPILKAFTIKDKKSIIRLIFNKNTSRPMCYYYGISWRIRGDIINKNFEIVDNDNTVLLTHRGSWSRNCDCYDINITEGSRELLLIASAICVDLLQSADEKQLQTV
ncbi:MAG: hypothetical protein ACI4RL_06285 [Ruminococcus sp.]